MSTCDHQNFECLPNEILIEILCKVSDQEWLAFGPLRLVCKKWYTILSSKKFWKIYHSKSRSKIPSLFFYSETYDWSHIANFKAASDLFGVNLVKNGSGELTTEEEFLAQNSRIVNEEFLTVPWPNYLHWRIWSSGSLGWKVIKSPELRKPKINPKAYLNHPSLENQNVMFPFCFFTSDHSCTKDQIIDLQEFFIRPELSVLRTDTKFK